MNIHWRERTKPPSLEGRYEFKDYSSLREFLDRAAELSEREGLYPDLGFGKDYVNVTIHPEEGATELESIHHNFAKELDNLVSDKSH